MSISDELKQAIRERATYICEYCHSPERLSANRLTVDHVIPKSLGGSDELDNLALACRRCNERRYNFVGLAAIAQVLSAETGSRMGNSLSARFATNVEYSRISQTAAAGLTISSMNYPRIHTAQALDDTILLIEFTNQE